MLDAAVKGPTFHQISVSRKIKNSVAESLFTLSFVIAMVPLVWVLYTVIERGFKAVISVDMVEQVAGRGSARSSSPAACTTRSTARSSRPASPRCSRCRWASWPPSTSSSTAADGSRVPRPSWSTSWPASRRSWPRCSSSRCGSPRWASRRAPSRCHWRWCC